VKPSYGRISRYGIVAFASSLDQVGPITRTVWDSARLLEVMSGYHAKDATSSRRVVPSYTDALQNYSTKNLRIGVAREWLEGVDPEIKQAFEESLKVLTAAGAKLVDIKLPHVKYALSTYYLVAPSEASSNLARFDGVHYGHRTANAKTGDELYMRSRGEGFGPEVKLRIMLGTYALSAGYYDAFYLKANQVRSLIQSDFDGAFSQCDCVAAPTSPTTAFKLGEKTNDPIKMYLSDIFTLPVNLAGLPGISIPCGLDKQGLPMGLQLIGRSFDETLLLQVSHSFEKARGGFEAPPPLREGGK
jgi:aspartyl-tRNA(Asn)/glutamyl-tRNA(Gln) amidotransferase subunit A